MINFLIYGSYGYTGQLIVELATKEGMRPILAGRDEKKLREQAEKYNLEYRAFSLDETDKLDSALLEVEAVLHCAGPFVLTFRQMAEACIRTKRHYVDISGEIEGFEVLAKMDDDAKQAGIMLLPGGGFDVVPSDCLAAYLKGTIAKRNSLPIVHSRHRRRCLARHGTLGSREHAPSGTDSQRRITHTSPASVAGARTGFRAWTCPPLSPWAGEMYLRLITAPSVPNIETYFAFPRIFIRFLKLSRYIGPLVYSRPMRNLLKWIIGIVIPSGPSSDQNENGFSLMVGEMRDENKVVRTKLRTPEGYRCTALTTVEIMKRISNGDLKAGFQTPSLAYGADFILQFDGVERENLK